MSNAIEQVDCAALVISELDWVVNRNTVVRPDLMIICGDVPEKHLTVAPGLVAEVLSDSTRQNDLNFKRDLYESEAVPTYLVIDPNSREVICHRLVNGHYQSTPHSDTLTVTVCSDCNLEIDLTRLFR